MTMSDLPNKSDFIADERPGEYEATFSVRGTIRVTIKAGSLEEARAKADAMTEDEEFGLELDEADDVSLNWVGRQDTSNVSRHPRRPDDAGQPT